VVRLRPPLPTCTDGGCRGLRRCVVRPSWESLCGVPLLTSSPGLVAECGRLSPGRLRLAVVAPPVSGGHAPCLAVAPPVCLSGGGARRARLDGCVRASVERCCRPHIWPRARPASSLSLPRMQLRVLYVWPHNVTAVWRQLARGEDCWNAWTISVRQCSLFVVADAVTL